MSSVNFPPAVSSARTRLGMRFPFQRSGTSFPAQSDPNDITREHIESLILTALNERVMNTNQGVSLDKYVFENMTEITMARIASELTRAISAYVPDVTVLRLFPAVEKNEDGTESTISITVKYREGNQVRDLQVPVSGL